MQDKKADSVNERVLFVRVGWMKSYCGNIPGLDELVGGGAYNRTNIGGEEYNFRKVNGKLYGYFQPPMSSNAVALERIEPSAAGTGILTHVLVIFVARRGRPAGRQVVVGWYRDAELLRSPRPSPGKPNTHEYFCSASAAKCVLIPSSLREFKIPAGKGAIGKANVCYPMADGAPKNAKWMRKAIDFVRRYQGENLLTNPAADVETEVAATLEGALARSTGQGFAANAVQRRAIEKLAMSAAKKYFRRGKFSVTDVSASQPYDLECRRGKSELHVEVKGTTTPGRSIVLTNNEVKHACTNKHACALFVLHSIKLAGSKAFGGKRSILMRWRLRPEKLQAISYVYRLE